MKATAFLAAWGRVLLVGMLMGAAEVAPGVSGGTIAFVSGYYERLLRALAAWTPASLLAIRREGLAAFWLRLDAGFMLALFGAMGCALFLLAGLIGYLLEAWPIALWAFFFGLVAASAWVVGRQLRAALLDVLPFVAGGLVFGLLVSLMIPLAVDATPLALFLGGSLAVCAWILPGVSGSFILLILGLYPAVLRAARELDLSLLFYVGAGCAIGIIAFARFLSYLLARHRHPTYGLLTGFMLGSLMKVWPWQVATSYQLGAGDAPLAVTHLPVLPQTFAGLTGGEPYVLLALASALAGAGVILLLDSFAPARQAAGGKPGQR